MFRYFPSETSGRTVKLDHYLNIDEQGHLLLQKTGDNGGVFTGTQVGGTVSGNKHCSLDQQLKLHEYPHSWMRILRRI